MSCNQRLSSDILSRDADQKKPKINRQRLALLLLTSYIIAAFGAPSLSGVLSIGAGAFGYALFWLAWLSMGKKRFWVAVTWFTAVQAVQLSWLTSLEYMGPLILGVYGFVIFAIGLQFAFLTSLIRLPLGWMQTLALAGFWALMEWSRLFCFTGFSWNPLGLSLAANSLSIQFAALFGVYGLCFWVIWVNLLGLKALLVMKDKKKWVIWVLFAAFPYAYGVIHRNMFDRTIDQRKQISVALVQTALRPEEREYFRAKPLSHVHPLEQWDRIFSYLNETGHQTFDLIVFPEGALPNGAKHCVYSLEAVQAIWERNFKDKAKVDFPPYAPHFAAKIDGNLRVSNSFLFQAISNRFGAEVIVGLDDFEGEDTYNAAFHYIPKMKKVDRYEKRILIPIGEYIPFFQWKWLADFIADHFQIPGSFVAGKHVKIFEGVVPIGIFICLEETYSHFVREIRQAGAKLLVNVTNDVWFPKTRLPWHHFDHGRLRAVENGICLLRACNTGVTAAIDSFGDPLAVFPVSEKAAGALHVKFSLRSFPTLYTFWGDSPILLCSASFFFLLLAERARKKKKLL